MNKLKKARKKNLNVVYVFEENNQVYAKNNASLELDLNTSSINGEWYPIHFQWKSVT